MRVERPADDASRHRSSLPRVETRAKGGTVLANLPEASVLTYFCPVCGIELEQSDFEKPAEDYYCPFCSSRQTPSRAQRQAYWEDLAG